MMRSEREGNLSNPASSSLAWAPEAARWLSVCVYLSVLTLGGVTDLHALLQWGVRDSCGMKELISITKLASFLWTCLKCFLYQYNTFSFQAEKKLSVLGLPKKCWIKILVLILNAPVFLSGLMKNKLVPSCPNIFVAICWGISKFFG